MIYITGDKHRDYNKVFDFCYLNNTTKDDILIVLGDSGINYCLNESDYLLKDSLDRCPITFFCIHGNHEERPENINTYKIKSFHNGKVYYEEKYPSILFAKDGEIYNFNDKNVLVIGGAYSVDKEYRLAMGYNWYKSEQPSDIIKKNVKKAINNHNNDIDIILSHTCPYKYIPNEVFVKFDYQNKIDHDTEKFLDDIEKNTKYLKWYCGHFHIDKSIDKIRFMMHDIEEFN